MIDLGVRVGEVGGSLGVSEVEVRLIDSDSVADAIGEAGHDDLAVVCEKLNEVVDAEATVGVALFVAIDDFASMAEEGEGGVNVGQCNDRVDTQADRVVDEVLVVLETRLVDGTASLHNWNDPSPGDRERIVFDAHRSNAVEILLEEPVIFGCGVHRVLEGSEVQQGGGPCPRRRKLPRSGRQSQQLPR